MSKVVDLTGQRFGRLTVIERYGSNKDGQATWLCQCDCGNQPVVRGGKLRSGHTTSCGCLFVEKRFKGNNMRHGKSHTRLFYVWHDMKRRCYYPKYEHYDRYGGRGISVCDAWLHDFQAFYDWAIANGYDENAPRGKCTIDRIDNDKGYSPDNCRWVDAKAQADNRSNSKKK